MVMVGMILATLATAVAASPEKDAVKAVIKAVEQGEDLSTAFPGAITARESASLQRVSKCAALNLMKHKEGYYTVVWDCGSKGALGMEVVVTAGVVTSVSTMEIVMRAN
jgi:hypothetical protein